MAKISLNNVASGYNRSKINQNFVDLQAELQNKVLYRNNPTGEPNQMESDIDMNSKDISNAKDIYTQRVKVNGKWITAPEEASARDADTVTYDNTTSGLAATEVQAAVDEVEGRVDTAEADITTVEGRLNNVGAESVTTATGTQSIEAMGDDRVVRVGSVAGLAALTPSEGLVVNVGGVEFKRVGSNWVNLSGFVTPQIYGADGTATNDTAAINAITASTESVVKLTGDILTNSLTLSRSLIFFSDNDSQWQVTDGSRITVTATDVRFHNINANAGGNSVSVALIDVEEGAHRFWFKGGRVGDIATSVETINQCGIRVYANDVTDLEIDTEFENISCMGDADGSETGNGFAQGFFLQGDKATAAEYTNPSSGYVNGIYRNIYTERNPSWAGALDIDADAIRTFVPNVTQADNVRWKIHFGDSIFDRVQKSCLKISSTSGISTGTFTVYTGDAGGQGVDEMVAVNRIQYGDDVFLGPVNAYGKFQYMHNLVGENIETGICSHGRLANGDGDISRDTFLVQNRSGVTNKNIRVGKITTVSAQRGVGFAEDGGTGLIVEDLSFDVSILYKSVRDSAALFRLGNSKKIRGNINVIDPDGNAVTVIQPRDGQDIEISGYCEFTRQAWDGVQATGSPDTHRLKDFTAKRIYEGSDVGLRVIDMRTGQGGTANRIPNSSFENVTVIMPEHATNGNDNPARLSTDQNGYVKGFSVQYYTEGSTSEPGSSAALVLRECAKIPVSGIKVDLGPITLTHIYYAVQFEVGSGLSITDVDTEGDGVRLDSGVDDVVYSGIRYGTGRTLISNASGGVNIIDGGGHAAIY